MASIKISGNELGFFQPSAQTYDSYAESAWRLLQQMLTRYLNSREEVPRYRLIISFERRFSAPLLHCNKPYYTHIYIYLRFKHSMTNNSGSFVISLDFELMWGVRDEETKATYGNHILGVHQAMPRLLACFTKHSIKATFATVGFLFVQNKDELVAQLPAKLPEYHDQNLSPFGKYLESSVGFCAEDDPYHYGWHLLQMIQQAGGQEIGTHTFSHYYCLEPGQTAVSFEHDLRAAYKAATGKNINLQTIIFPRNQVNQEYLKKCALLGIKCYRGNESSWIYKARRSKHESLTRRAVRLLDAYVNLSGHHCYADEAMASSAPYNIPSSRFLRPYSKKLKFFESLRLKRILMSMTYAAKNNLTYHLWWHPHNFGINQDENFHFLEKILEHYQVLNKKYDFRSYTMSEVSKRLEALYGK